MLTIAFMYHHWISEVCTFVVVLSKRSECVRSRWEIKRKIRKRKHGENVLFIFYFKLCCVFTFICYKGLGWNMLTQHKLYCKISIEQHLSDTVSTRICHWAISFTSLWLNVHTRTRKTLFRPYRHLDDITRCLVSTFGAVANTLPIRWYYNTHSENDGSHSYVDVCEVDGRSCRDKSS